MLSFRRCLAASFFLNAARRQVDGTYRYSALSISTEMLCKYLLRFIIVVTLTKLCDNGLLFEILVRVCCDFFKSTILNGMRSWVSFISCFRKIFVLTPLGLAGLWQADNQSVSIHLQCYLERSPTAWCSTSLCEQIDHTSVTLPKLILCGYQNSPLITMQHKSRTHHLNFKTSETASIFFLPMIIPNSKLNSKSRLRNTMRKSIPCKCGTNFHNSQSFG